MKKLTDFQKNFLYVVALKNEKNKYLKLETYSHRFVALEESSKLKYCDAINLKERLKEQTIVVKLLTAIQQHNKALSTH